MRVHTHITGKRRPSGSPFPHKGWSCRVSGHHAHTHANCGRCLLSSLTTQGSDINLPSRQASRAASHRSPARSRVRVDPCHSAAAQCPSVPSGSRVSFGCRSVAVYPLPSAPSVRKAVPAGDKAAPRCHGATYMHTYVCVCVCVCCVCVCGAANCSSGEVVRIHRAQPSTAEGPARDANHHVSPVAVDAGRR